MTSDTLQPTHPPTHPRSPPSLTHARAHRRPPPPTTSTPPPPAPTTATIWCVCTPTCIHARVYGLACACMPICMHAYMHARAHAHTRSRTCTHAHIYVYVVFDMHAAFRAACAHVLRARSPPNPLCSRTQACAGPVHPVPVRTVPVYAQTHRTHSMHAYHTNTCANTRAYAHT